jgi:hypothetical protein
MAAAGPAAARAMACARSWARLMASERTEAASLAGVERVDWEEGALVLLLFATALVVLPPLYTLT